MASKRRLTLAAAACCLIGGGPAIGQTNDEPPSVQCETAGRAAEQTYGLPPGLLLAIGRVESGRWDPAQQRTAPWPWTINAAGKGSWFETPAEAIQTVRTLRAAGTQSIDTGCFQINLLYHPMAFASPEQAFDAAANASYAARFLVNLYTRLGTWDAAVAAYHSADPAPGAAYRQSVYAVWTTPPLLPEPIIAASIAMLPEPENPTVLAGVRVWTPMRMGSAPNVVPVAAAASQGALPTVVHHRFTPGE